MSRKIVIAGSATLQDEIKKWKKYWEERGDEVINCPVPVSKENYLQEYSQVHTEFFRQITKADVLFIMNEDKNGIGGYVGAETFAEMCFGVAQNLVYSKNIEVIILKMPSKQVQACTEINLWLQLDWIKVLKN